MNKKAVVLLSGGLDSATCLAIAKSRGFECYCLSLDYHQRHIAELQAANKIATTLSAKAHKTAQLDLSLFGGSALTDSAINVPESGANPIPAGIPVTYVPARNTIMLSLALAWAEVLQAQDIFIGVNALDYSGYPDCRGEYVEAFQQMANLATKSAVEGQKITIHAPLIELTKAEIIHLGIQLGVDYAMTVSCYQADDHGHACGKCDSCRLRREGFIQANIKDPTRYKLA
ncbi:MAG: 7-cyano-7-deazaguanine synthase QueC [Methylotenera sp.]|nr:MAG: 7-cyano-7-deazaguanine synthase QueC [Proteobacteria bacterium ST_bin12]PPC86637.1 MAG: 7-cyano-7-deazaguanine synthase QueC [Methylotenera sp.]PPD18805.1 MAG: 7-cyano-7-deazaguanine synthase QueC [Methylotenera sp.]